MGMEAPRELDHSPLLPRSGMPGNARLARGGSQRRHSLPITNTYSNQHARSTTCDKSWAKRFPSGPEEGTSFFLFLNWWETDE